MSASCKLSESKRRSC